MKRLTVTILAIAALTIAITGCGKKDKEKTQDPAAKPAVEETQPATPAAEGEAKPAAEGEAKPAAEGEAKPAAEGDEKADEAKKDEAKKDEATKAGESDKK